MRTAGRVLGSRSGAALFTTLVVIMSVSAVVATVVSAAMQRSYSARRLSDRVRAQSIAEAGANLAYSILTRDFDSRTNAAIFASADYAGGRYLLNVKAVGENVAVIRSTGICQGVTEEVILDVSRFGVMTEQEVLGNAFDYMIVANHDIVWTGASQFENRYPVHANSKFGVSGSGFLNTEISASSDMTLKGNSCSVDGDAAALTITDPHSNILGTKTVGAVDHVAMPAIDLTAYYIYAALHGQVYNGKVSLSSGTTVPGGVMWVNGDLALGGSTPHTGCFIATGTIKLTGSSDQIQYGGLPAFMSRDGDIEMGGNGNYEGLVWTRIGHVKISGGGRLKGTIISGGNVEKSGGSTAFAWEDSRPMNVAFGEAPPEAEVTVWQK